MDILIAVILPILVIQLALIVVALRDLFKPERRVKGGSKPIWILVIVFFQFFGPIIYFLLGREDE